MCPRTDRRPRGERTVLWHAPLLRLSSLSLEVSFPVTSLRAANALVSLPVQERLKVNEIFYSIQGESSFAGRPCVFVRLTGCQMRCSWCDTEYAFYEGVWWRLSEICAEVASYGCDLVEITGGEPLLQPGVHVLMERLCNEGYRVLLETGGGVDISGVDARVHRIVDVKCPGSGEALNNRVENYAFLTSRDEVKFVLRDRPDYDWAKSWLEQFELAERCLVSFSPVADSLELRDLAEWVLADRLEVRLQAQLHKLMWGDVPGR